MAIFFRSGVIRGGARGAVFGLGRCPASSYHNEVAVGRLVMGLGGAGWVVSPPYTGVCDLVVGWICVSCGWSFSVGSSWVALGVDECVSWSIGGTGSFVG